MPTYEYKCTSCNTMHDIVQKINDPEQTVCPKCGEPTLVKQISRSVHIQFTGSGFYSTDYPSKGSCCGKCNGSCEHNK